MLWAYGRANVGAKKNIPSFFQVRGPIRGGQTKHMSSFVVKSARRVRPMSALCKAARTGNGRRPAVPVQSSESHHNKYTSARSAAALQFLESMRGSSRKEKAGLIDDTLPSVSGRTSDQEVQVSTLLSTASLCTITKCEQLYVHSSPDVPSTIAEDGIDAPTTIDSCAAKVATRSGLEPSSSPEAWKVSYRQRMQRCVRKTRQRKQEGAGDRGHPNGKAPLGRWAGN